MRGYEEGQERLRGWESRAEVHETKKEKEMTEIGKLLAPDILEKNGWYLANGVYVLKSVPRLGWNPKTKTLITGYYEFPVAIEYVHQLQQLMGLLGIEKEIEL